MKRVLAMVVAGLLAVAAVVYAQQQISPKPDSLKGRERPNILREQKDLLPDTTLLPPLKKVTKPTDKRPANELDPEIYQGLLRERDTAQVDGR